MSGNTGDKGEAEGPCPPGAQCPKGNTKSIHNQTQGRLQPPLQRACENGVDKSYRGTVVMRSLIYPHIHPSSHLSVHPSSHPPNQSSIHTSLHPSTCPIIHLPSYLFSPSLNHPFIPLAIHSSLSSLPPSVHPSFHPSITLFIHLFIQSSHSSMHSHSISPSFHPLCIHP